MDHYDTIILGAGVGGLMAANLWASQKERTLVLEAHYAPGGCAGYFKRKEGVYHAGATTISGLSPKRPLYQLLSKINKMPKEYKKIPLPIVVKTKMGDVNFYADKNLLIKELSDKFHYDFNLWLNQLYVIEEELWEIIQKLENFPKVNLKILSKIFKHHGIFLLKNYNLFTKKFLDLIPKEIKRNDTFIKFVDEILMISSGTTAKECPAFIGILSLLYPLDTYSLPLGVFDFIQNLAHNDFVEFKYREQVLSIEKNNLNYIVHTNNNKYICKNIISNINLNTIKHPFNLKFKNQKWSAACLYFTHKSKNKLNPYLQLHIDQNNLFKSSSIFISNYQESFDGNTYSYLASASIHLDINTIENKYNDLNILKNDLALFFTQYICQGLEITPSEMKIESIATHKTFERYTKRPRGEVGGYASQSIFELLKIPGNHIADGFYLVGDYAFPGQGIVAIAQGVLNTKNNNGEQHE